MKTEAINLLNRKMLAQAFFLAITVSEFIFSPIYWIIFNIILNGFNYLGITNDMVKKTGLPSKICINFAHKNPYATIADAINIDEVQNYL